MLHNMSLMKISTFGPPVPCLSHTSVHRKCQVLRVTDSEVVICGVTCRHPPPRPQHVSLLPVAHTASSSTPPLAMWTVSSRPSVLEILRSDHSRDRHTRTGHEGRHIVYHGQSPTTTLATVPLPLGTAKGFSAWRAPLRMVTFDSPTNVPLTSTLEIRPSSQPMVYQYRAYLSAQVTITLPSEP